MDKIIIELPKGKKQMICEAMKERWANGKDETPEELTVRILKNSLIETFLQIEANKVKEKYAQEGLKME